MNLTLKSLYGSNFRCLIEPFRIDFPTSGTLLVKGLNKDTNDSSDSGKSSLVLATAYLFGGCPFPATELASWGAETPMIVGGYLTGPDGEYRVERSNKNGLTIWTPRGKTLKGRNAESQIDKLFGMDEWLRAAATYRGQGESSLFLGLTDEKKKEFLTRALMLDRYEKVAAEAAVQAKARKEELQVAESALASALAAVAAARTRLEELPQGDHQADAELCRMKAKILQDAAAEARTKLAELLRQDRLIQEQFTADLVAALDELAGRHRAAVLPPAALDLAEAEVVKQQDRLQRIQKSDQERRAEDTKVRQELKSKIAILQEKGKNHVQLNTEITRSEKRIATLEQQSCPTCERPWVEESAAVELVRLKKEHAVLWQKYKEAYAAAQDIVLVKGELDALPAFEPSLWVAKIEVTLRDAQRAVKSIKDEILSMETQAEVDFNQARFEIKRRLREEAEEARSAGLTAMEALNREINQTEANAKVCLEKAAVAHRNWDLFKERTHVLDAAENTAEAARLSTEELRRAVNAELDLYALVGREGFLGIIFDDVLNEIAAATNAILSRVANVRHVAFGFSSERETGSGSIQRRITPVINLRGREVPLKSGISGGQGSSVQLAVDLAVGEVVAKRRGSYPNWLILDETFDGLGRNSKESCIDLLQTYGQDRLILVIDHSAEFQSLFTQTINVESEGGRAKIVQ
jgi:DNA repair exonuclease SbcCD ATPase subunit